MVEITKVTKSLQVPICGKDSKIEIGYESDIYGTVFELHSMLAGAGRHANKPLIISLERPCVFISRECVCQDVFA